MLDVQIRQAATTLLDSAIRIAPSPTREWGHALRGELNYVEGSWAGTMWALGGASVMVKQAIVSLVVPSRAGHDMIPDGGLFARNPHVRRAALALGGACVLAALLFFGAPPFRQAFQVAMQPWLVMYRAATGNLQPGIAALARRAEKQHDAQGLAFCAVRARDAGEGARLAEEAVHLDATLTWVYAIIALAHPGFAHAGTWMGKLERWDPQNGLISLIQAETIVRTRFPHGVWAPPNPAADQAWSEAMAQAFAAPKFDDYFDKFTALNRQVVPRYRFYDPYEVESRWDAGLPDPVTAGCERFAILWIRAGQGLEAQGDLRGAREKYWAVARFGQLIDSQAHSQFERRNGAYLQSLAYRPLEALAKRQGDSAQATLFGYLAEKFNPLKDAPTGESAFGHFTSKRNAAVVEISGLMILVFSGLVLVAAFILIAGSRRGAVAGAQRDKPVATFVALTGALGMLFSAVTLYLTYRPYWYIFQSSVVNGERAQSLDLYELLNSAQMPPGVSPHGFMTLMEALVYSGSPGFLFYVWGGVTLLGVIGLILILLRHFLGRPHAHAP